MSLLFRDNQGNETHIAGLNGVSGELVPSVSLYQNGVSPAFGTVPSDTNVTISVTFTTPMPDTNYVVVLDALNTEFNLSVSSKLTTGFSFHARNVTANTVTDVIGADWSAFKLMTDETTQLDEAQIELNKQDITAIKGKIPSNASSSNQLVTASDTVKRVNYSITGTTDAVEDTKTLVNYIITLGEGSYVGEFKRTGITFGSFRIIYFTDGDGTISISGTVTYSISNTNDSTYQVSYVLSHGSDTPHWNIEKLVVARENNFTYKVLTADTDLNNIKTSGTYSIYISDTASQATNHAPGYGWLQLIVIQMNNSPAYCNQILYSGAGGIFKRECSADVWTSWKQLVSDEVITGEPTSVYSGVGNVVLKKQGKMVTLTVNYDATNMPASNWTTIMNIPVGFRPAYGTSIPVGNPFGYSSVANLYATGELSVYKHNAEVGLYNYINATWTTE